MDAPDREREAPAATDTISNPDRLVWESTAPETKLNVSTPAPPERLPLTLPPTIRSVSVPLPSETEPVIVAPLSTVTVADPAPSEMAVLPAVPTAAPLRRLTATRVPEFAAVLIAASPAPLPPRTVPDAVMVILPLAAFTTLMPNLPPVTFATEMVVEPVPPALAT